MSSIIAAAAAPNGLKRTMGGSIAAAIGRSAVSFRRAAHKHAAVPAAASGYRTSAEASAQASAVHNALSSAAQAAVRPGCAGFAVAGFLSIVCL